MYFHDGDEKIMKLYLCTLLFTLVYCPFAFSQSIPEGLVNEVIFNGGQDAVSVAFAPDGRIFVADKNGKLLIFDDEELKLAGILPVETSGESGLLGITLDPDFAFNKYIYVYYTLIGESHNRLSRFLLDDNHIHLEHEEILLDLDLLDGNYHHGSSIKFGSDRKLYISTGDGGKPLAAQSQSSLLGKILRLNSDGTIPTDNPFYFENEGIYKSIYALGFRNPFSTSFSKEGKLFVNDVGEGMWEEINDVKAGKNYGWPLVEGSLENNPNANAPENHEDPIYAYSHSIGCAITGSAFSEWTETSNFPREYDGKYFFGDCCTSKIFVLDPATLEVETFATMDQAIFIMFGDAGDLYYIRFLSGGAGRLHKISMAGDTIPRILTHPGNAVHSVGEKAEFNVKASGEEPITYQWIRNGIEIGGASSELYSVENVGVQENGDSIWCKVENVYGVVESNKALLSVTNRARPMIAFDSQAGLSAYRGGDTLVVKGFVTDEIEGNLHDSAMVWKVDFHHGLHYHPVISRLENIDSVTLIFPKIGETSTDVWYRIHLTATNNVGLSQTSFIDISPKSSLLKITGSEDSLLFSLDGTAKITPYQLSAVAGMTRSLSVTPYQFQNGNLFKFKNWSTTFLNTSFTFDVPVNDTTFQINYEKVSLGSGSGLTGFYYDTAAPDEEMAADLSRIDKSINFDWGNASPASTINSDTFSIVWRGYIRIPLDGAYKFTVVTEGGVQVWINETLLIDEIVDVGLQELSAIVDLTGERLYPIQINYYDSTGAATLKLYWSSDIISPETLIPTEALYSTDRLELTNIGPDKFKLNENILFKAQVLDSLGRSIDEHKITWLVDYVDHQSTTELYSVQNTDTLSYTVPHNLLYSQDAHLRIQMRSDEDNGTSSTLELKHYPVISPVIIESEIKSVSFRFRESTFLTPKEIEFINGYEASFEVLDSMFVSDSTLYMLKGEPANSKINFSVVRDTSILISYDPILWENGDGLTGTYSSGLKSFQDVADSVRVDKVINFLFENLENGLKVYWDGWIKPVVNGSYSITASTPENVLINLNEDLYIVEDGQIITNNNPVVLEKEKLYPIKIFYETKASMGAIELLWSFSTIEPQLIPQGQLFSISTVNTNGQSSELISLSPNPTSNSVTIDMPGNNQNITRLAILNTLGQVVQENPVNSVTNEKIVLDLTNLRPGLYFLSIEFDDRILMERIVKQ